MKIPENIKIGGHKVKIGFVRKFSDKPNSVGRSNFVRKRITLATHFHNVPMCESERAVALLHEIVHQTDDVYEAKLSENQVRRISQGLFQVLRDNKLRF